MARTGLNWENAMTATHETLARPASLGNAATAIFALLGLIDVALTAVVVTRVISAVLVVPPFFLNAPAWVTAVEGFVIAATITALVLVHQQGRRPGEATP
jgi:hypothetical protein